MQEVLKGNEAGRYSTGNDHSLAPCWVSGVLALAVAQPYWQTEGLG